MTKSNKVFIANNPNAAQYVTREIYRVLRRTEELIKILDFQLKDDKKARFLTSKGTYEKPDSKADFSAQDALMRDKRK